MLTFVSIAEDVQQCLLMNKSDKTRQGLTVKVVAPVERPPKKRSVWAGLVRKGSVGRGRGLMEGLHCLDRNGLNMERPQTSKPLKLNGPHFLTKATQGCGGMLVFYFILFLIIFLF